MALLNDFLPELKEQPQENNTTSPSHSGKKRRAWLEDETCISKGSINLVHKPFSQKNKVSNGAAFKGSIDQVYRPLLCFEDLRSNPLQIFRYLFELTKRLGDDYKTPKVKISDMMLNFNLSKDSARTALRFLLKHKFIERIDFQAGSMGWSRYQLNIDICKELERGLSMGFIDPFKPIDKKELREDFDGSWDEIDFSGLESIGFNKKHFLQLKNKTTPQIVQESINHFAFGLAYNKKTQAYTNPLATLITVLKRGEIWVEPNYQSSQALAQEKLLQLKKKDHDGKKEFEEKIYKMAFEDWQMNLSEIEKENLSSINRKKGDIMPVLARLSAYFREHIWPKKKKEYLF